MKKIHFDNYFSNKYSLHNAKYLGEEIIEGFLKDKQNFNNIPIVKGIPRFILKKECYAKNFGIQWNKFKSNQLDSISGLNITFNRFWKNTKWNPQEVKGKIILEAGSGAGRFTEILLKAGAKVVSFDMSNAVDANYDNNYDKNKDDLFIMQANIYDIPFEDHFFDFVFCYGVIQHTPDPNRSYKCLFQKLKKGGKISIDCYRNFGLPRFWFHYKYSWRKITTKINPKILLKIIQFYMPIWLPIDILIRKLPQNIGNKISYYFPIPCWNYFGQLNLKYNDLLKWAIMDTFDALGATYDFPKTMEEIQEMIKSEDNENSDVFYGSNGIVANVKKK